MTKELKEYANELPERRKGYQELAEEMKEELQAHADRSERRLHSFFAKSLIVFAILGITSAGSLLGFGIVLGKQKQVTREIQQERYNTLLSNCEAQNDRHDRAILRAESILSKEGQKSVRLLVDELQPMIDNCEVYSEARTRGGK